MNEFVFKQFVVKQQHSAMKIGTDSVLLGCLAEVQQANTILDIGTGTGLLALMCAQRCNAQIDAVEIDLFAANEAKLNFELSAWSNRLTLHYMPLQQFVNTPNKYDLIITNPPYFEADKNYNITNLQRSKARHDADLPFAVLIHLVVKLLNVSGSFWLILPTQEAAVFKKLAINAGLFLNKQINIKPHSNKNVNREVLQFSFANTTLLKQDITIYNLDGSPTIAYKQLSNAFYIGKQFEF